MNEKRDGHRKLIIHDILLQFINIYSSAKDNNMMKTNISPGCDVMWIEIVKRG